VCSRMCLLSSPCVGDVLCHRLKNSDVGIPLAAVPQSHLDRFFKILKENMTCLSTQCRWQQKYSDILS